MLRLQAAPGYNATMQPAHDPHTQQAAITVQARFFALYRERVGQTMVEISLPAHSTVGDLVQEVHRRYPEFSPNPNAVVVAVNREYVVHTHVLAEKDEAAFIPPVSGGSEPKSPPVRGVQAGGRPDAHRDH